MERGRWEVVLTHGWEVGNMLDGRWTLKIGGRLEVDAQNK